MNDKKISAHSVGLGSDPSYQPGSITGRPAGRAALLAFAAAVLLTGIAACGQKGPLNLPATATKPSQAPAPAASAVKPG
ncbi:putative small lipoprotein YifL [Paucibacter oligotrophus]|uniref:Putative small lipoprotein YifL n=1 Tax=Roseateles oligotrophus TaxID=1769250 RepID=A0A840LEZ2_9BURK|nr:lipoprotein [Roseateles oligotrophus]MBB4844758.1 putative small lipoprotein YifL [Roseateles oligotrophus]